MSKIGLPPEDSQAVQVREHEIAGLHITEVVVGEAGIDDELPLLVQFHGRSSRPTVPGGDQRRTPPMRLMLPWAPEVLGDGFTWFPLSVTEPKEDKVLGHYIRERVDQLAGIINASADRRPTEGLPIITGFSQGGMMGMGLAMLHPELIDGAFPLAGWLPTHLIDEGLARHPDVAIYPPIRIVNGDHDPVVPTEETLASVAYMQERGLDVRMDVFPNDAHNMTSEMYRHYREQLRALIRRRRHEVSSFG